ncbi:hypothetical protein SNE40_003668 [Patella caerulea]|uniref:Serine protease n=2 Tax=Patella caerulea TaxID=87958 RepID=A0AAN8Q0H7_PATCE
MSATQFKVEVGSETDVVDDVNTTCQKNPGHEGFIPFTDLSMEHLPEEWRIDKVLEFIKYRAKLVVRLVIIRPDQTKWYGTGYVSKFDGQYVISTNNHVIRNDKEAKRCLIEFNYDSEDRSNVIQCEGTGLLETSELLDKTLISFLPIPRMIQELDLVEDSLFMPDVMAVNQNGTQERSNALTMPYKVNDCPLLAIPHCFDLNKLTDITIPFFDGTRSELASNFIKFQPIPEILMAVNPAGEYLAPTATVRMLDDNNQIRTATGTVEKISDQICICLPKPLTEQEAKKCQIQFADGSISTGIGVYFKNTTLFTANIKGLDMDFKHMLNTGGFEALKLATTPFWMVPFKPPPKDVIDHLNLQDELSAHCPIKTVVIVGHPHGWRKMVTFGRDLGINLDLTGGEYRCSVSYTGKTCPGSSGSPVLYLRSFRCYIHHGGQRAGEYGTEIVETSNVNKAWWWKQYLTTLFLKR